MQRGPRKAIDWEAELSPSEVEELRALRVKEEELEVVKMQITTLRFRGTWRRRQKAK